jgi:hypothetical protein
MVQGQPDAGCTRQILSSFQWDEGQATAHFLLSTEVRDTWLSWYVTLCVVTDSEQIFAVGKSKLISSLSIAEAVTTTPWREPQARPSQTPLDMTLIKRSIEPSRMSDKSFAWTSLVGEGDLDGQWSHHIQVGRSEVSVDILTPGPLPPAAEASIKLTIDDAGSSATLTITLKAKVEPGPGSKAFIGSASSSPSPLIYYIPMPEGVEVARKARNVKLSRALGLIVALISRVS